MARDSGKTGRGSGRTPSRELKQRVKTARGRKTSSTRWLQRQLNDPYVAAARREGWRSRAAFKLIEIDDKYRVLRPGMRVVDLGCAPGGWTQVAVKRVGASGRGGGRVIGVDVQEVEPIAGAELIVMDFMEADASAALKALLGGQADIVMSDMAAPSTGHRHTDHLRIMALCEAALDFALEVLKPGGAFLAKVLQGGAERDLLETLKSNFSTVRHVKPGASRADSAEMYVLATGFRAHAGGRETGT